MGKSRGGSGRRRKAAPALSGEDLGRLRSVLESQRALGGDSYPVAADRLFALAGLALSDAALASLARGTALMLAQGASEPEGARAALVFLPEDVELVAGSAAVARQVFAAAESDASDLFTAAELAAKAPAALRRTFQTTLEAWAAAGRAPLAQVLLFRSKGKVYFHWSASSSARARCSARPIATFAEDFARAFDRLDLAAGKNNYVLLHDLRLALPQIARSEFDERLRELRKKKVFTLDSHDGRHVRLSPEQLAAGIREDGSNLVYVARRGRA